MGAGGAAIAVMEKPRVDWAEPRALDVRPKRNDVSAKTSASASPTRSTMSPNPGLTMVKTLRLPVAWSLLQPWQLRSRGGMDSGTVGIVDETDARKRYAPDLTTVNKVYNRIMRKELLSVRIPADLKVRLDRASDR
jgi:hypothetical protein